MALHLKYRPKDFNEIISNKSTISSLKSLLENPDHPHSYLLIGPSGCGKTTIARIIANKLDCHKDDIIEIDAGSERGVETADNLIESIHYKPFRGSVKVYIVDEIQATSSKFQETLLKTLEDTPRHVYFVLCTTDPNKIKKTIKTRCTTYEISRLSTLNITKLLNKICVSEDIEISEGVIKQISIVSNGCPRQALVILDQAAAAEPSARLKLVKSFEAKEQTIKKLIDKLLDKNSKWKEISSILKNIKEDPEKVRISVLMYCNAILLNGSENTRLDVVMEYFKDPFYTAGKALLTMACRGIFYEE